MSARGNAVAAIAALPPGRLEVAAAVAGNDRKGEMRPNHGSAITVVDGVAVEAPVVVSMSKKRDALRENDLNLKRRQRTPSKFFPLLLHSPPMFSKVTGTTTRFPFFRRH
ncbi:hypothetical protein PIB30_027619 [Stylosanthes scabra]|uniref:Uncharacterized protein n=1 Tax=Stylosanthes scabra TaxID=79078 RepID=A0ABU6Z7J0_9FABA|nr:hypothetical protein [Stylosanthes scabra]